MRGMTIIQAAIGLLILAAIAWALGTIPKGQESGTLLTGAVWLLWVGASLPFAFLAVMFGIVVFAIIKWASLVDVAADIIRRSLFKRKKKATKMKIRLSAIVLVVVYALAIFWVLNRGGRRTLEAFNELSGAFESSTNQTAAEVSGNLAAPSIPFSEWLPFLFTVGFGALLVVVGAAWVRALGKAVSDPQIEDEEPGSEVKATADASRIFDETIEQLETGGDYRTIVIRCYEKMCRLLADNGIPPGKHMTAREFEAMTRSLLAVSGENIGTLTRLFEEARYSTHDIDESQRDRAISCLDGLRTELWKSITPYETRPA